MAKYNFDFGKLDESGDIEYAPIPLVIEEENVWTNAPDVYTECGYYPIRNIEIPERDGFYYTYYYELEGNEIVGKWEEHEEVILPESETITKEQIQDAIEEGVNSI